MMTYDLFKKIIDEEVKKAIEDVQTSVRKIEKLNNQSYEALTVTPVGGAVGVNVNLKTSYDMYTDGVDIDVIISDIVKSVNKNLNVAPVSAVDILSSYEDVKDKLTIQLVNAEKNKDMLTNVPHKIVNDLAVVYRIQISSTDDSMGSILFTNDLLTNYGIDEDTLYSDAMVSAVKNRPAEVKGMMETLYNDYGYGSPEYMPEEEVIWVATTPDKINGAAVILYPDFKEEMAKKFGKNFFILPSSLHEVLLVPDEGKMRVSELKELVCTVNSTEVRECDLLSDNVYYYDNTNHEFKIAS